MAIPTVIIPAAGDGTRTQDLAFSKPKPLISIQGKPIISWILEGLYQQGLDDVVLVVPGPPDIDPIATYIRGTYGQLLQPRFVQQEQPLGPLHAVSQALPLVQSSSLLVVLADTICLERFQDFGFDRSWVLFAAVDQQDSWCLVESRDGYVDDLIDKPSTSVSTYDALVGVYHFSDSNLFTSSTHSVLGDDETVRGEYQLSSAIMRYTQTTRVATRKTAQWFDCGSIPNLKRSAERLATHKARAFNEIKLSASRGLITKLSATPEGKDTLDDEIAYYCALPKAMRSYFPRMVSSASLDSQSDMTLEYWPLHSLADSFLYQRFSVVLWSELASTIAMMLAEFRSMVEATVDSTDCYHILFEKTELRISQLRRQGFKLADVSDVTLDGRPLRGWPRLRTRTEEVVRDLSARACASLLHGDLCFSNILSDASSGVVKTVDPRGRFGATAGIFGDQRYDLAKLRQSYHGGYDFIVNGLYRVAHDRSGYTLSIGSPD